MNAGDIPSECLQDPQFVKVLTASLCSQISESKAILAGTDAEIQELKDKVERGLEKRKVLKQFYKDLKQKKASQESALESLERDGKKRTIELKTVKNGLDDTSLRQKHDRANYEKILENYELMWQQYKASYEEFPLAKKREESRTMVQKLEIELMVIERKRDELRKMLEQRRMIDGMRIRTAGVDVARLVLQRWTDEKALEDLQIVGARLRAELKAYENEFTQLQEQEERRKREEIETSKMPPPRLDFSFMRPVYTHSRNSRTNRQGEETSPFRESDSLSVNTLILEEMCKGDENVEEIDDPGESSRSPKPRSSREQRSAPVIQEVSESTEPSQNETRAKAQEPMNIVESEISDQIRNLGIEKKLPHSEEPETADDDDNIDVDKSNDYNSDTDESLRRTRLWCEESSKKNSASSESANDSRRIDENDENSKSAVVEGPKGFVALGSEASFVTSSRWSANNDKDTDNFNLGAQQSWCNNALQKANKRKFEESPANPDAPARIDDNVAIHDGKSKRSNENAAQVARRSEDSPEAPSSTNDFRPKIVNIEKIDHPLGQRFPTFGNFAPMSSTYAPSCASSDNFSAIFAMGFQKGTPVGNFRTGDEETPGSPMCSQIYSPPRAPSMSSFTSTIMDQQNATNERPGPSKEKSPIPPMNFGGFTFGNKCPKKRSMF